MGCKSCPAGEGFVFEKKQFSLKTNTPFLQIVFAVYTKDHNENRKGPVSEKEDFESFNKEMVGHSEKCFESLGKEHFVCSKGFQSLQKECVQLD
jgi:hypothetical protein